MPVYVALLRGVNVGGARSAKMADVKAAFEAGGATDVQTYIQSGNVVFSHVARSQPMLVRGFQAVLKSHLGFEVTLTLRTPAELAAVVKSTPFPRAHAEKIYVYFLPAKAAVTSFDSAKFLPEQFKIVGRELYVLLPNGVGTSKLVPALLRKPALALATGRRLSVVEKILELATR